MWVSVRLACNCVTAFPYWKGSNKYPLSEYLWLGCWDVPTFFTENVRWVSQAIPEGLFGLHSPKQTLRGYSKAYVTKEAQESEERLACPEQLEVLLWSVKVRFFFFLQHLTFCRARYSIAVLILPVSHRVILISLQQCPLYSCPQLFCVTCSTRSFPWVLRSWGSLSILDPPFGWTCKFFRFLTNLTTS